MAYVPGQWGAARVTGFATMAVKEGIASQGEHGVEDNGGDWICNS